MGFLAGVMMVLSFNFLIGMVMLTCFCVSLRRQRRQNQPEQGSHAEHHHQGDIHQHAEGWLHGEHHHQGEVETNTHQHLEGRLRALRALRASRLPTEPALLGWLKVFRAAVKVLRLRSQAASLMTATKQYSSLRQSTASRPSQMRKAALKILKDS